MNQIRKYMATIYDSHSLHEIHGIYGVVMPSLTLSLLRVINVNFPSSLTRNITSHSKESLASHSLLRWKMIVIQILPTSLMHFLFKRLRECTFWVQEWKGYGFSWVAPFNQGNISPLVTVLTLEMYWLHVRQRWARTGSEKRSAAAAVTSSVDVSDSCTQR